MKAEGETTETIHTYTGKAGIMRLVDTMLNYRDANGQVAYQRLLGRRLEFEGMEVERSDAITKLFIAQDFIGTELLLNGRGLSCPFIQAALAKLETAVVIEDTPDILSLTKDFINDQTKQ